MRAKLSIAVEDPLVAKKYGLKPERMTTEDERFFLDGPVAERVAIVDRDPNTGKMAPPVTWEQSKSRYKVKGGIYSPQGIAASVFGIVLPESRCSKDHRRGNP